MPCFVLKPPLEVAGSPELPHAIFLPGTADLTCAACSINPYAEMAYDGVDLNPMEVLFVKVKSFLLQAAWVAPTWAQTYDRWLTRQVKAPQGRCW